MAHYSGQNASATFGGNTLCVSRWSVNTKVDEVDTTTTCNSGFSSVINGVKSAEVTIEGIWGDLDTQDIYDAPLSIDIGEKHAVILNVDDTNLAGSQWSFPSFLVTGISMDAEVRGTIRFTINGMNDGSFTAPTV